MQTRVLFFGKLKDIAGVAERSVEIHPKETIDDLFQRLSQDLPQIAAFRSSVVASRNQEFAPWSAILEPDDEVAFLPPVSGG